MSLASRRLYIYLYIYRYIINRIKTRIILTFRCKTDDLLGDETVGCIVLIDEVKQPPFSFSCKILNPSSYPATVDQYEILIGNIVEIDISDELDLREVSHS